MKQLFSLVLCLICFAIGVQAQEVWSLEKCIREALDKSLLIRQFELNEQSLSITGKQLKAERIPSLNASSNVGISFGRVINPATNNFETENSTYQSLGLNSGVLLFGGFRLNNSIKQNSISQQASAADRMQAENDLALNVALAYLQVLFAYENEEIAQNRLKLSQDQLAQLDRLIEEGARAENDRYDILSQVALDEQSLITAQNNIEINLLSLKQQMWLEPSYDLQIERPEITFEGLEALENETLENVFDAAQTSQPQIKAALLRKEFSEYGVKIARSQTMPSLSIGADIGSNWSDLAKEGSGYILQRIPQPGVYIDGQPSDFEIESLVPTQINSIPYFRQLDNNIGYGVGASLSIPIFNNNLARSNVQKAKLEVEQATIEAEKVNQTLRTSIQNAIASARAAKKSMQASQAASDASRIAWENAERRLDLGAINNYEWLAARNRFDTAENNLLIAKYEYYFRIKVIEYYLGRGIRLN